MTARALRVGVLLGDKLVEERLFTDRGPITIGQSLRCRMSIPADGVPMEHVLFAADEGELVLRVGSKMTGRLAQNDTSTELADGATVRIARGARGKLHVGDATILFQEVAPPPVQPKAMLPASVRGTLGDRIDARLATIVGASVLAHIAIAAIAWSGDVDTDAHFAAQTEENYQPLTYDITLPDDTPPPVTTPGEPTGPGVAKPVKPDVQLPPRLVPNPTVSREHPPTRPDQLTTADEARRLAQIMSGGDESPNGRPDVAARAPRADLHDQIRNINQNGEHVGDAPRTSDPVARRGTTNHVVVDAPANEIATVHKHGEDPKPRVLPVPDHHPPTETLTLTIDAVLARVTGLYMAGLERCYAKGLLGNGQLSGTVTVALTVDETGHVSQHSANGVSGEVDSCIDGQMGSWQFPVPRDKATKEPTEASFRFKLALSRAQ